MRRFYRTETGRAPEVLHGKLIQIASLLAKKRKVESLLDIGCGDGSFTLRVAQVLGVSSLSAVDISPTNVSLCKQKGIDCTQLDISQEDLPFSDESFDMVTAFEVLEHVFDTDRMLAEAHRVLCRGGIFLASTPNLCSWINRLLTLLGYLPMHYNVSLTRDVEKRPLQRSTDGGSYGHVRLYNLRALLRQLEFQGLKSREFFGAPLPYAQKNWIVRNVDRVVGLRSSLAANLVVLAEKP